MLFCWLAKSIAGISYLAIFLCTDVLRNLDPSTFADSNSPLTAILLLLASKSSESSPTRAKQNNDYGVSS